MGRPFLPYYGEDLGSAIETAEKVLGKIKSNKFDKHDLEDFATILEDVANKIKTEIK